MSSKRAGGRPTKGDRVMLAALVSPQTAGGIQALSASTGCSRGDVTGALLLRGVQNLAEAQFSIDLDAARASHARGALDKHLARVPHVLSDRARMLQADLPGPIPLMLVAGALISEGIRRIDSGFSGALTDAASLALNPATAHTILPQVDRNIAAGLFSEHTEVSLAV